MTSPPTTGFLLIVDRLKALGLLFAVVLGCVVSLTDLFRDISLVGEIGFVLPLFCYCASDSL